MVLFLQVIQPYFIMVFFIFTYLEVLVLLKQFKIQYKYSTAQTSPVFVQVMT